MYRVTFHIVGSAFEEDDVKPWAESLLNRHEDLLEVGLNVAESRRFFRFWVRLIATSPGDAIAVARIWLYDGLKGYDHLLEVGQRMEVVGIDAKLAEYDLTFS